MCFMDWNSNSSGENFESFRFLGKITWVPHEIEFELELRKFETFAFLPKLTWVPDRFEFEFELKKFETFPSLPKVT